jgi:hypothetical protein
MIDPILFGLFNTFIVAEAVVPISIPSFKDVLTYCFIHLCKHYAKPG